MTERKLGEKYEKRKKGKRKERKERRKGGKFEKDYFFPTSIKQ
jgi:hypothetical protein